MMTRVSLRPSAVKDRYYAALSAGNKAARRRAQVLHEYHEALGEDGFLDWLRDREGGLGLNKKVADREADLATAFGRYQNHELLWDALGDRVVRILRISDATLRGRVVREVERQSQFVDGFISNAKFNSIITTLDPTYYRTNPGQRAVSRQQLSDQLNDAEKKLRTALRSIKGAIESMEVEGYDGRSFFEAGALRLLDRAFPSA